MGLQVNMWLLVALMFGILYEVITGIGTWMGAGNVLFYLILAFLFIGLQYLIGPSLVQFMMRVKWVSEEEEPELRQKRVKLSRVEKMMELFTTHPNMLKRIKRLAHFT